MNQHKELDIILNLPHKNKHEISTRDVEFVCDGLCLKGCLHLPGTPNPPLVMGSHGLEGSMDSSKQLVLSKLLPQNGIAFFRFDHRGCGRSQGNFIDDTSLEKRTRDFTAAVDHILNLKLTSDNLGLFGSSMGGATGINAWEHIQTRGLNLCGGVFCSAPIKSRTIENIPVEANQNRPALPLSFFKENLLFDLTPKIHNLNHVLIFHGDADEVVPVSNAQLLHDQAQSPKKLIIHKNGDHQMTNKTDQQEFEKETLAWFLSIFSPVPQT